MKIQHLKQDFIFSRLLFCHHGWDALLLHDKGSGFTGSFTELLVCSTTCLLIVYLYVNIDPRSACSLIVHIKSAGNDRVVSPYRHRRRLPAVSSSHNVCSKQALAKKTSNWLKPWTLQERQFLSCACRGGGISIQPNHNSDSTSNHLDLRDCLLSRNSWRLCSQLNPSLL